MNQISLTYITQQNNISIPGGPMELAMNISVFAVTPQEVDVSGIHSAPSLLALAVAPQVSLSYD